MTEIQSQRISFTGSQGYRLDARLDLPAGTPQAYAIFSHCFTCTKETLATYRISRLLAKKGIAVLRFDFTGLGNSEGEFADTNFSSNIEDIICAEQYLRENHQPPSILLGHSLGGTAAFVAASQLPHIKAIITIASPSEPDHVLHHFEGALIQLNRGEASEIVVAGQRYKIKPQFVDDVKSYHVRHIISELDKALLIFHGPNDRLVDVDHSRLIFDAAEHPKSLVSLHTADHILSEREDNAYVADVIYSWLQRYIQPD